MLDALIHAVSGVPWRQLFADLAAPMTWGMALLVLSAGIGWIEAAHPQRPAVRWLDWWLRRVIRRIVMHGRWVSVALALAVNNTAVLALIVASGWVDWLPPFVIVAEGFLVGAGVRLLYLAERPWWQGHRPPQRALARAAYRAGLWLNALELPAIAIAVGLAMLQCPAFFPPPRTQIWQAFALLVVPLLLVAAVGEALWIVLSRPRPAVERESSEAGSLEDVS